MTNERRILEAKTLEEIDTVLRSLPEVTAKLTSLAEARRTSILHNQKIVRDYAHYNNF